MKDALKIGWARVIGFMVSALRRLSILKGVGWSDSREEAFKKAKAEVDATDPSVNRPFIDRNF